MRSSTWRGLNPGGPTGVAGGAGMSRSSLASALGAVARAGTGQVPTVPRKE